MSENSQNSTRVKKIKPAAHSWKWSLLYALGLPAWVFIGFLMASEIASLILGGMSQLGLMEIAPDDPLLSTVFAAAVYVLALLIVVGGPWLVLRRKTSRADVGLTRLPSWTDILLTPAGYAVYAICSGIVLYLVSSHVPFVDITQEQEVGFTDLSGQSQYLLAFVTLVILAPISEEILFRGYLQGKLKKHVPLWLTVLITSALFGAVHGQWNVGIDTFVAGVMMSILREVTGSLWPSILLHMLKNGLAYYLLFINPSILNTLGGT